MTNNTAETPSDIREAAQIHLDAAAEHAQASNAHIATSKALLAQAEAMERDETPRTDPASA